MSGGSGAISTNRPTSKVIVGILWGGYAGSWRPMGRPHQHRRALARTQCINDRSLAEHLYSFGGQTDPLTQRTVTA